MTSDEFCKWFLQRDIAGRLLFCLTLAADITIAIRALGVGAGDADSRLRRVLEINEVHHRVVNYARELAAGRSGGYSAEDFCGLVFYRFGEAGAGHLLEHAVRKTTG
jgi:hypothetical protein